MRLGTSSWRVDQQYPAVWSTVEALRVGIRSVPAEPVCDWQMGPVINALHIADRPDHAYEACALGRAPACRPGQDIATDSRRPLLTQSRVASSLPCARRSTAWTGKYRSARLPGPCSLCLSHKSGRPYRLTESR